MQSNVVLAPSYTHFSGGICGSGIIGEACNQTANDTKKCLGTRLGRFASMLLFLATVHATKTKQKLGSQINPQAIHPPILKQEPASHQTGDD